MAHRHRVMRAEPVSRERVRERLVYVPVPAPSNWPERHEASPAKPKPPLHERMWFQILGASVLAVILAIAKWLGH
jgi:hypothetical protein